LNLIDWTRFATAIAITAVTAGFGALLTMVTRIFIDVKKMRISGELRKTENLLLIKGVLAGFSAIREGKVNGNVESAEAELREYLLTQAVTHDTRCREKGSA
jgi:hypothetical protein